MTSELDYGIDAPRLHRQFLLYGATAMAAMVAVLSLDGLPSAVRLGLATASGLVAMYLLFMASLMWYCSRIWKIHNLRRLFNALPKISPDRVLDVGCGRGLMAIEAARRYPTATVTGIDIWSAEDQSNNTREACLENVKLAGVASRIEVQTCDARELSFDDQTFDLVVSHWVLHNLPSREDREQAIREIHRVLRDDGCLLLVDIECIDEYVEILSDTGWLYLKRVGPNAFERFAGRVSFGSFRPTAIVGARPHRI